MRDNPIQFAVVREDPVTEESVIRSSRAQRALLVASGGCTALSLATRVPELAITLFDINEHQLALCEQKRVALAERDDARREALFNVETDTRLGLNACGNFESLFRSLRLFVEDLVASTTMIERACLGDRAARAQLVGSPYWPVAFDLFFADPLLHAMFGPEAVQHAPAGSYARYFQRVFERGLEREDVHENYFVHHVLLGRYLRHALPLYLRAAPHALAPFDVVHGTLEDVPDLGSYDLVSLSNLFDWMNEAAIEKTCRHLAEHMRSGATLMVRQLNSALDLRFFLADHFELDEHEASALLARDCSLFYARLWIARRR